MSGQGIKGSATLKKGERLLLELKQVDAVLLSPSLGCPALVSRKDDGTAFLEMVVLSRSKVLTPAQVAFHVRLVPWSEKDRPARYRQRKLKLFDTFFTDVVLPVPPDRLVKVSKCHTWNKNTFGLGDEGWDINDADFTFKFALSNVFDWVMKEYSLKGYRHLFKVAVNLDYEDVPDHVLFNLVWLEKQAVITSRNRPSLSRAIQDYIKSRVDKITHVFKEKGFQHTLRTQLSDYGGINASSPLNTMVSMYHPVYVSSKKDFTIGHVTDIHLDTRMEIYSQSEASVIEVKENCGANLTFNSKGRITRNKDFHEPIKKKVANFNGFFMDICKGLIDKGADLLVITGDLVDYNQGPHTVQTYERTPEKPSRAWNSLNKSFKDHKKDRNWLQFYKYLLCLYDQGKKPIFTLLGNHDYVKYAMAPWPVFQLFWNGVYDQNLTRYETALMFGEHDYGKVFGVDVTKFSLGEGLDFNLCHDYKSDFEFIGDYFGYGSCVLWYSFFINPFADYVVDLGRQSLLMVDWGCTATMARDKLQGAGGLHHACHVFKDKMDFGKMVDTEKGPVYKKTWVNHVKKLELPPPFEIRNGSIYSHWVYQNLNKTKILFMHPTVVCPRDDVSDWEVEHIHTTMDKALQYGSFGNRRHNILDDIEQGYLHMAVSGHSHRNMIMELSKKHPGKVRLLSSGETLATGLRKARNLVLVTSSAGPIPTCLSGPPLVCGCTGNNAHNTGYYFDKKRSRLLTVNASGKTTVVPKGNDGAPRCPYCSMHAWDMVKKPSKRHRPGGNLLSFHHGQIHVQTVPVSHSLAMPSNPRMGPRCEEWGVMKGNMMLKDIHSEDEFHDFYEEQTINIISASLFKRYSHMEFPSHVSYVTFDMGNLSQLVPKAPLNKVRVVGERKGSFESRVAQTVVKKSFEYFLKSALQDESMAFMRYSFNGSQTWDREITITKHLLAKSKDLGRKVKSGSLNAMEKLKSMATDHKPRSYTAKNDPFEGMIIVFKKHPDFRKRRDPNVCGY